MPAELAAIVADAAHRPWPMPTTPWVMTQTWENLLFAHWPIAPSVMRPLVPRRFDLDTFDGRAWIAVVPFTMSGVRSRWMPSLPHLSAFPELNVRTYVSVGGKPGVFFFSLDAARLAAVVGARAMGLPYYWAAMTAQTRGDVIDYESRRRVTGPRARLSIEYRAVGPPTHPRPGTIEHFLTERYCLYSYSLRGRPYRLEIHHPRWDLQPAAAEIRLNQMFPHVDLRKAGEPLLHVSKYQRMVGWLPMELETP